MAKKTKNLTLAAILLGVALNSATLFAQAAGTDIIVFKSGEEKRGVAVISESYKEIKVKEKAAPGAAISERTYPAGDVLTIRHGRTPAKFSAAQAFQNQGRYEEAIKKYEEAAATDSTWVKPYSYFNIARCLWMVASDKNEGYEKALTAYQRILDETPDSRFAPDAKLGVGRCHFEMGQLAEAQRTFRELEDSDYGEEWELRGRYWRGRVLDAEKRFADAVQVFTKVSEKAKDSFPQVYYDAQLARGKSLSKKGDFSEAEAILTELAEETDPSLEEVKAAAYNALGDCYWAQEQYRDALFAFLRVKVLYFGVEEEHAYALYWAAKCFEKYKDDRAQELYAELTTKHPDSEWSKKVAPQGEE